MPQIVSHVTFSAALKPWVFLEMSDSTCLKVSRILRWTYIRHGEYGEIVCGDSLDSDMALTACEISDVGKTIATARALDIEGIRLAPLYCS